MPVRKSDASAVYQLKVTLKGSKPPIWRRIQVRGSTTLPRLHRILQGTMGWSDYHLHQFISGGVYYGVPDPDWESETQNERRVRLEQVVSSIGERFVYEYDFGDSWQHEILVEKLLPPDPSLSYPVCLTGKRACPPEDVGGVWGYGQFLEAIRSPAHPEHEAMLTWVGGAFDPEAFDLAAVNQALQHL